MRKARALGGGVTVAVISVTASARRSRNRASRDLRGRGVSSMSPAAGGYAAQESGTAARRAAAERRGRAPAAAAASAASMSAISSSLTMSTGNSCVPGRAAAAEEEEGEAWCIGAGGGSGEAARCGPHLAARNLRRPAGCLAARATARKRSTTRAKQPLTSGVGRLPSRSLCGNERDHRADF